MVVVEKNKRKEKKYAKQAQTDLQQFYAKLKTSGRLIRQEAYEEVLSEHMVRSCHASCRLCSCNQEERRLNKKTPLYYLKKIVRRYFQVETLTNFNFLCNFQSHFCHLSYLSVKINIIKTSQILCFPIFTFPHKRTVSHGHSIPQAVFISRNISKIICF